MTNTNVQTVAAKVSGYLLIADSFGSESSSALPGNTLDASTTQRLPIAAISATYLINEFPTAMILIPVGKAASTDDSSAMLQAQVLAKKLTHMKRIECFVVMEGEFAPGRSWPASPIRVFNGYVTGTAIQYSADAITLAVTATHWLMDLDASSALSSELVPGSPTAIGLPPLTDVYGASVSANPDDQELRKLGEDVWLAALKPKFIELCDLGVLLVGIDCSGAGSLAIGQRLANDVAKKLLLGGASAGAFDISALADIPNMEFITEISRAMAGELSSKASATLYNGTLGNSSFWDKLLEFAGMFGFAVIPTVDTAVCAPISPVLTGGARHTTIKASEFMTFQINNPVFRAWRGVGIIDTFIGEDYGAASDNFGDGLNPMLRTSGCYLPENDESLPESYREAAKRGSLRFIRGPDYVTASVMSGVLGVRNTIPMTNPDCNHTLRPVDSQPTETTGEASGEDTIQKTQNTLGYLYAKWYYWIKQFQDRTGELSGKLRFDISPGSIVRIEDIDSKFYGGNTATSYLYANVAICKFNIDTRTGQAETSFSLTHIRREPEKDFGVASHPLFTTKGGRWVGTVLQNIAFNGGSGKTFIPTPGKHETAS